MYLHSYTFLFHFIKVCSLGTITFASYWVEFVSWQAFLLGTNTLTGIIIKLSRWDTQFRYTASTFSSWYRIQWMFVRIIGVHIITLFVISIMIVAIIVSVAFLSLKRLLKYFNVDMFYHQIPVFVIIIIIIIIIIIVWCTRCLLVIIVWLIRFLPKAVTEFIIWVFVGTRMFVNAFSVTSNVFALSAFTCQISFVGYLTIANSHPSTIEQNNNNNECISLLKYNYYNYFIKYCLTCIHSDGILIHKHFS